MARRSFLWTVVAFCAACRREHATVPPPQRVEIARPSGDSGPGAPPPDASGAAEARERGRWVPGLDFLNLEDGRLGAVVNGRRVVVIRGKASVIDTSPLPGRAQPKSLPPCVGLPAALGGGWLFIRQGSLYFSPSFDGDVRLVSDGITEESIGIGYGSALVEIGGQKRLFELSTGRPLAPPIPDLAEIFALRTGEVVARTGKGAVYLARRRDEPFKKVATARPVVGLGYFEKEFVLYFTRGPLSTRAASQDEVRLTRAGRVHPPPPESGDITSGINLYALDPRSEFDLHEARADARVGERMLDENAVAILSDAVLAVREKDLVTFDAKTGQVVSRRAGFFAQYERCELIRGGKPSFAACQGHAELKLVRIDDPAIDGVEEHSFPKIFLPGELGRAVPSAPIVSRRRCNGDEERGAFCVRRMDGSWADVPPPPDPDKLLDSIVSIAKATAEADGTPYGFAEQRRTDDLIIVDGRAKTVKRIPRREVPALDYRSSQWNAVTVNDGEIHFLFPGDQPGVLIVRRDGRIDARKLGGHMAAIGRRALQITEEGVLRETLDGGETFHDVTPPPAGADPVTLSCQEGGCHVGPWLRLGWGP